LIFGSGLGRLERLSLLTLPATNIMDKYEEIEEAIAAEFGKSTTTRKATGDFMLDENHAVNIKSNNLAKNNYSPNMTYTAI
jgi:hypothetical protein